MKERSILSYFPSSQKAKDAQTELKAMGVEVAQVDRISRYPTDIGDDLYNPLAGEISSLTNLTQNTAVSDDAAVLMSSDPAVSGMSAEDTVGGRPFILTAVTTEEQLEKAVQVIKKHGGLV